MSQKPKKPKSLHEVKITKYLTAFYGQEQKYANQLRPHLATLKDEFSLSEILAIAKSLDKHPAAYSYLYGNPFPKSYGQLRNAKYNYQSNLEHEFNWYAVSIVKFFEPIRKFLEYREMYEVALMTGNYVLATDILDKIEIDISVSFWGMEQRFLIAELSGGLKNNKDFLSNVNSSSQDAFVTTFAYFFSNRSENKMSVQRYNNFFNNFFQSSSNEIREYFQFVVHHYSGDDYSDLAVVLNYHNLSSIIDKYITFIKVAQLESVKTGKTQDLIVRAIIRVQKVIKDPMIDRFLFFTNGQLVTGQLNKTTEALQIFDNYSVGKYADAIVQAKQFIQKYPTELSVYEVYIKSHLFLRKEFLSPIINESPASEILDNMFNIFEKNDTTSQSLANILKIATTLQSSSIGNQLYAFYSRSVLEIKNNNWKLLDVFNSQVLNPLFVKRYLDKNVTVNYIDLLIKNYPLSPTIALFEQYFRPSHTIQSSLLDDVPDYRKSFYIAERHKESGDFEQAIKLYTEILGSENLNVVLYEDALVNLMDCYLKIGSYENFLERYVKHHFSNANLLIRVETKYVVQQLQMARFRNVSPSILLPIFFYITKQDSHNVNIALRVFLKGLGLVRSADLRSKTEFLWPDSVKFLLYNICTPEILKYSTYFEGTNDILLERVEVLQILVNIDKTNSSSYDAEISKITQDLAVIDAIRQIDESKIYVDEASLINSEFSDVRNNFNRYIEISNLITDQRSSFIDISFNRKILLKVTDKNIVAEDWEHARVSRNVKFELFKEVFFEIRDGFLFNNRYGLDVYLSTRIRHGTLLGQFRNEFQTQHLITQKDKLTESYFRNDYWDKKLSGLEDDQKDKIQLLLSGFSEKVDKTANDLKERAIQIKTEDRNVLGLFDYKIPNDRLLVYYDQVFKTLDQYNNFVYVAIQLLWRLTEVNLEYIRKYISENVKERLLQFLSELEADLRTTVRDEREIQELLNSIKTCRTQIHLELDKIADWFKIRKVTIPDFNISKVINSSLEITNKISQNAQILEPEIEIKCNTLFKGKFFIHLFDLLRIFLENIVNYSELESSELQVTISAIENDEVLHFRITNNVHQDVDRSVIRDKFQHKVNELSAANWDMNKIRTEKDTGFYKAKKNLTSDLQDENNNFDFKVNESDQVEINIYIHTNKLKA